MLECRCMTMLLHDEVVDIPVWTNVGVSREVVGFHLCEDGLEVVGLVCRVGYGCECGCGGDGIYFVGIIIIVFIIFIVVYIIVLILIPRSWMKGGVEE